MPVLDTRREALNTEIVRGHPRVEGLHTAAPTTPSGAADLNVNLQSGTVVLPPKAQQFAPQADFDCGAAITDGETLPVSIVAYYFPGSDKILMAAVPGTSHATPATPQESRAYYASDATIEAAIPSTVDPHMYTVVCVEVFSRAGSTVTQYTDEIPRSYGLDPSEKLTAGDALDGSYKQASPDANAAALAGLVSGTATVLNGQTSVTVTAATLGGTFGGSPVQLTWAEQPTAATDLSAGWSTDDLVITIDTDNTADVDVYYFVDGR